MGAEAGAEETSLLEAGCGGGLAAADAGPAGTAIDGAGEMADAAVAEAAAVVALVAMEDDADCLGWAASDLNLEESEITLRGAAGLDLTPWRVDGRSAWTTGA